MTALLFFFQNSPLNSPTLVRWCPLLLHGILLVLNFAVSTFDSGASDVRAKPPRPR